MRFQLSMARRLSLGFVIIIGLFCLASGAATLWVRASTSATLDRMYSDVAKGNQYLAEAQNALWSLRFGVAQFIANPAQRKRWVEEGPKWFAAFDESLGKYSGTSLGAEQRPALDGLKTIYAEYKRDRPTWTELMETGKAQEAAEFRARTIFKSGHGTVDAFARRIEIHTKSGAAVRDAADAAFRQIVMVSIAAAQQLASASGQVATASEHQTDAAASMATVMEEMTVSISHVSASAAEARNVTVQTAALALDGNRVIHATVAEMNQVSKTVGEAAVAIHAMGGESQRMSAIVLVIKEVAAQTNLLALNASIKAARAGAQGRGFAVVADEVKKLAERAPQATGEISGMIGALQASAQAAVGTMQEAVSRVGRGVGMARQASDSMVGINDGTQRVVSVVNEISGALREQSAAANDIAANVEKIARMSKENRVATRMTAETALELERLASGTREAVGRISV